MYANIDEELGSFDAIWHKAKKTVNDETNKKTNTIFNLTVTYDTPNGNQYETFYRLDNMVLVNEHFMALSRAGNNGGVVVNMDKVRHVEVCPVNVTEEDKNGDT